MKILYITLVSKRKNVDSEEIELIDFEEISETVRRGINKAFKDVEISIPRDIVNDHGNVPLDLLDSFDLFISDISASTPQVHFLSGMVEGLGKPIIYICDHNHEPIIDISNEKVITYSDASLTNEFRKELNDLISIAKKNPIQFALAKTEKIEKPKAFISYSHSNKDYFSRLLVHLKPLERNGAIDIWKDTDIKIGDFWREEIDKALSNASIAILMISADFMASDFIIHNELPPLLAKAEVKGTKIVPIIVSPCRFSREPSLNRFQAANSPNEPLSTMTEVEREFIYDKVASDIENALKNSKLHFK